MQLSRASKDLTSGDPKLEQLLCGTLETILTICSEPVLERDCLSAQEKEQMWAIMENDLKSWLVEDVMDLAGVRKLELLEAAERCEVNKYYKGSVLSNQTCFKINYIKFRELRKKKPDWSLISGSAKPGSDIHVSNLSPATWYQIKVA